MRGGEAAPIYHRLFVRIRDLIVEGQLHPGSRLPASRILAESLGISRNSVLNAIEQLAADGWVEARRGAGVYVTDTLPIKPVGRRGRGAEAQPATLEPFALTPPGIDLFPVDVWRRVQSRRWRNMPAEALAEGHGLGWPGLRDAIADHLATTRGLKCSGSQVVITTSIGASIDLAVRALGLANSSGWVEDPGYFGFRDSLIANGIRACPVPVDRCGLDVAAGIADHPDARLAIVTPTAHFPTGAELSPGRRDQLVAWARSRGAWIMEDDYDSENYFDGLPSPPLSLQAPDVAIYMNSFNRMLFPALRVAFMVLPEERVEAVLAARAGLDGYTNVPNQVVLTDFIDRGHLDEHLRRCRTAYRERRDALLDALASDLGAFVEPLRTLGGLQVVGRLIGLSEAQAQAAALAAGVQLTLMRRFVDRAARGPEVVLGFAAFPPSEIAPAVRRLRAGFEAALRLAPRSGCDAR